MSPRGGGRALLAAAAALWACALPARAALVLPVTLAQITAGLFDPVTQKMLWGVSQPAGIGWIVQVDTSPFARTPGQLVLTVGAAGSLVENLAGAWVDVARRLGYFVSNASPTSLVRVNLDTFTLSGDAWPLPFPTATSFVTAQLFDYGRNTVYLGSSSPPGRLVRFNLATTWGLTTYAPGWISLNSSAGESVIPTSMVLDKGGVVYVGLASTPGRVVGVRVNQGSLARSGQDAYVLTTGGCAAATCVSPRAGVMDADYNASFWATGGTEGPSIVKINHTSGVITRWAPARNFLSSQPTAAMLSNGWAFWVATDGPSPTILRLRIVPALSSPSNITLQYGTGDVLAAVVDNVTSASNGWLYAAYNADPASSSVGMIANVAAWTGSTTAAMVESVAASPSQSQTPTSTRTGSITSSASVTSSANETDSRSRSPSAVPASPSRSATASVSSTSDPTNSRSGSQSLSGSLPASRSIGGTPSTTNSPASTRTRTGPGTTAATGTGTRTGTPTASATRSASNTVSGSITAPETRSRSPPLTPSRTGSPPPTATLTGTGTPVSPTSSKSAGASASGSASLTSSNTMSVSQSGSLTASISETATASGTPPPLPVAILSAIAVSWDGSVPSPRPTPSKRPSASATVTPSDTGSSGASATATSSHTPTATVSDTASESPTASESVAASVVPSATSSTLGTASSSGSVAASSAESASGTPSATIAESASGTPGVDNSSVTSSSVASSSATTSSVPTSLVGNSSSRLLRARGRRSLQADDGEATSGPPPLTIFASEAWLPTPFIVSADIPPGQGETVTVRCESLNAALQLVISPADGYTFTRASITASAYSTPRLRFNVTALFTDDQAAIDNEPDSWSTIECTAASRGDGPFARLHFVSTAAASLRVSVLRARWPLIQDAIIHLAKDGLVKSVFERNFTDIRDELFIGCRNDTDLCPPSDLGHSGESALDVPEAVQYALTVKGLLSGPRMLAKARAQPFDMQLSGATHVTLVADALFWYTGNTNARFLNTTTVSVAGVPCNITWITPDGRLLHMITPSIALVCVRGQECGYKPLVIRAGAGTFGVRADDSDAFAGVIKEAGDSGNAVQPPPAELAGTLSCPPFCPAQAPGTRPTVTHMMLSGSAPVIVVAPGRMNASTLVVSLPSTFTSLADSNVARAPKGIYFSAQCPSIYINDPNICTDLANPSYVNCAFGEGDDCQRCPTGAYCPGGYRAIVLPGYYVSALDRLPVIRCAAPSEERCLGWNDTSNAVQCGPGYRPSSYRCQSCAKGFFVAADGSCDECPPSKIEQLLATLFSFVASLVAFGLINYLFILAIAKYVGGTVAGGAKAALQLMIWTFTVIQTIVQVGKGASPGLPGFLRQAYAGLDVFSFGGLSPNTACLAGAYPFLNEAAQMGLALGLMLLVAALQFSWRKLLSLRRLKELKADASRGALARAGDALKPVLRRVLFTVLTLMYPIVMRSSMEMLNCSPSVVTVRAYLSMDQNGRSLASIGKSLPLDPATGAPMTVEQLTQVSDLDKSVRALLDASLTVSSLVSNSYFVCTEGAHEPVWRLAWVALLVYGIGYPLGTFLLLRSRLNRLVRRHSDAARAAGRRNRLGDSGYCTPQLAWLLCGASPPAVVAAARALWGRMWGLPPQPISTAPCSATSAGSDAFAAGSTRQLAGSSVHLNLAHVQAASSSSQSPGDLVAAQALEHPTVADAALHGSRAQPAATIMAANPMLVASRRQDAAAVAGINELSPQALEAAAASAAALRGASSAARWLASIRRYALCERRSAADVKVEVDAAKRRLDPMSRYLDAHPELLNSMALTHFTASDYRPSAFYFRNLDMALLFVLSALLVFWRRTPNDSAVAGKLLMTVAALLALSVAIVRVRPFNAEEVWKQWVKIFSLVLSICAGVLNGLTGFAEHAIEGGARLRALRAGIVGLSYVVFLMSVGLFLMLLGGFWYALVQMGRAEAEQMRVREAAAAAVALRRVVGGGAGSSFTSRLLATSSSRGGGGASGARSARELDDEFDAQQSARDGAERSSEAASSAPPVVQRLNTGLSLAQLMRTTASGKPLLLDEPASTEAGGGSSGGGGGGGDDVVDEAPTSRQVLMAASSRRKVGGGGGSRSSNSSLLRAVSAQPAAPAAAQSGGGDGDGGGVAGEEAVAVAPAAAPVELPAAQEAAASTTLAQALAAHAPADKRDRVSMIPSMVSARALFR